MQKLNNFTQIFELIQNSTQISIMTHHSPDGDAIGSTLALLLFLQKINKRAKSFHIDAIPEYSLNLLKTNYLTKFDTKDENQLESQNYISNSDLVLILDVNNKRRVGSPAEYINQDKATIVIIDHHLEPEPFANFIYQDVDTTSTCEIMYKFIWSYSYWSKNQNLSSTLSFDSTLDFIDKGYLDFIDNDIAISIYNGILTDTGNFKYFRTDAEILRIAANLLDFGIDVVETHKTIFESMSLDKYKLKSICLNNTKFFFDHQLAIAAISKEDFQSTHTSLEDTEGFSSMPLEIKGMKISIFIQEDPDEVGKGENGSNLYRISFRSFGEISIRDMAAHYGGGGHKNASGAKAYSKDIPTLIESIKDYVGKEFNFN